MLIVSLVVSAILLVIVNALFHSIGCIPTERRKAKRALRTFSFRPCTTKTWLPSFVRIVLTVALFGLLPFAIAVSGATLKETTGAG